MVGSLYNAPDGPHLLVFMNSIHISYGSPTIAIILPQTPLSEEKGLSCRSVTTKTGPILKEQWFDQVRGTASLTWQGVRDDVLAVGYSLFLLSWIR